MPEQQSQTSDADPRIPAKTIRSKRAWFWFMGTIIFGIITDLLSKSLAFTHVAGTQVHIDRTRVMTEPNLGNLIPYHESVVVIPKLLDFTLVLNPGAVFGIGAGQRWFFVIFTLIAISVAFSLFIKWTKPRDWYAHMGFGLIISGGLGNLYDRVLFACVRDFIHPLPGMKLPFGITWPKGGSDEVWPYVSNIADLYLLIGIGLLLVFTWRQPAPQTTEASSLQADQPKS
ncbi:MAG: signal peptidase II [Phycisphaerales bacterium]